MKIWLINNYCTLPQYGALPRTYYFSKELKKMGHEPVLFIGSHPHNTNIQLISNNKKYVFAEGVEPLTIYVYTKNYEKSKIKRILSMFTFYRNAKKATHNVYKKNGAPDVILGSSAHPLSALLAIKLAKKYKKKSIVEIRDLWPESIISYGIASPNNPIIKALYKLEEKIYIEADYIVFTMEGGKDYIVDKKLDIDHGGLIDLNKVYHINNGVDLDLFSYNQKHFVVNDLDLDNPNTFKVVYTGAIRKVNGIGLIVDTAKVLFDRNNLSIQFIIYGDGDERKSLENKVKEYGIQNIVFKGNIDKSFVPYILSKANACLLHWTPTTITRFGMSMNKTFEYLASGKPLISNICPKYDLIKKFNCGLSDDIKSPEQYANLIEKLFYASKEEYELFCNNSRMAANQFDFEKLTQDLINIIEK